MTDGDELHKAAQRVADLLHSKKYKGAELFTCRICKRPVPNGMACVSCTT